MTSRGYNSVNCHDNDNDNDDDECWGQVVSHETRTSPPPTSVSGSPIPSLEDEMRNSMLGTDMNVDVDMDVDLNDVALDNETEAMVVPPSKNRRPRQRPPKGDGDGNDFDHDHDNGSDHVDVVDDGDDEDGKLPPPYRRNPWVRRHVLKVGLGVSAVLAVLGYVLMPGGLLFGKDRSVPSPVPPTTTITITTAPAHIPNDGTSKRTWTPTMAPLPMNPRVWTLSPSVTVRPREVDGTATDDNGDTGTGDTGTGNGGGAESLSNVEQNYNDNVKQKYNNQKIEQTYGSNNNNNNKEGEEQRQRPKPSKNTNTETTRTSSAPAPIPLVTLFPSSHSNSNGSSSSNSNSNSNSSSLSTPVRVRVPSPALSSPAPTTARKAVEGLRYRQIRFQIEVLLDPYASRRNVTVTTTTSGGVITSGASALSKQQQPQSVLDVTESPQSRALFWLVYVDPRQGRRGVGGGMLDPRQIHQRWLLVVLYFATDGPYWQPFPHKWLSVDHHCTWEGVRCDGSDGDVVVDNEDEAISVPIGSVTELVLRERKLMTHHSGSFVKGVPSTTTRTDDNNDNNNNDDVRGDAAHDNAGGGGGVGGGLPTELFLLTDLVTLDLSKNYLGGTLPTEIGALKKLVKLQLSSNGLVGTLPTELGKLVVLERLELAVNRFSGTLPSQDLSRLSKSLRRMELWSNSLTGRLPTDFMVPTLVISSSETQIEPGLSRLTHLFLDRNRLTGPLPNGTVGLPSLQVLSLGHNLFSGPLPKSLVDFKYTTNNDNNNNNNNNDNDEIDDMSPRLRSLWLDSNLLTGTLPRNPTRWKKLHELYLEHNRLTGEVPRFMLDVTKEIRDLKLHHNDLTGCLPPSLLDVEMMKHLRIAHLHHNRFDCTLPHNLWYTPSTLLELRLDHNRFQGTLPNDVVSVSASTSVSVSVSNLQVFSASDNLLEGTIPTQLGLLLPKLELLELANNNFTGSPFFMDESTTTHANANGSANATPTSPPLMFPSGLRKCDLSGNALDGPLWGLFSSSPWWPTNLTHLYLQNNSFTGTVVVGKGGFASLSSLSSLSSDNTATATGTTSAPTTYLQALRLEHNRLGGRMPLEFCTLPHLSEFTSDCDQLGQSLFGTDDDDNGPGTSSSSSAVTGAGTGTGTGAGGPNGNQEGGTILVLEPGGEALEFVELEAANPANGNTTTTTTTSTEEPLTLTLDSEGTATGTPTVNNVTVTAVSSKTDAKSFHSYVDCLCCTECF